MGLTDTEHDRMFLSRMAISLIDSLNSKPLSLSVIFEDHTECYDSDI
jgi:hypothetical protein